MRIPSPGQWQSAKLSQGYVADYKPFQMVDGEGVRCSLYVSGCLFACEGCFNEAAWSFRYGQPYDDALEDRILTDLGHEAVQGLTLLGGEPFLNTAVCLRIVRAMREVYGRSKDVWCWTGYTFEQIMDEAAGQIPIRALAGTARSAEICQSSSETTTPRQSSSEERAYRDPANIGTDKLALLELIDVLVDGPFDIEQRDLSLAFRGSRNQRLLDARASLAAGRAVAHPVLRDGR